MRQDHVSFYSGDQSGESYGSFVKTDNNGNYFVAGRSNGYGTKLDYAVVKYSAAGEILWERRYNGTVNGNDEPFGLTAYDFVAIKYSPSDVSDTPVQQINLNNYPNPFNPSTKISFDLSQASFVTLKIYDVTGREILIMANEKLSAGDHSYTFDASKLNSGVYFYKLETTGDDGNKLLMTRKMMLVK